MARDHTTELPPDFPRLLSGRQVLAALGIDRTESPSFLWRLRRKGTLPAVKIGKAYKYPEHAVRRLVAGEVA